MKSPRKIILSIDAPQMQALMRLIETQSKPTLGDWALTYAEANFLPLFEKVRDDRRPRLALLAARTWFSGGIKLPEVREHMDACHTAAKDAAPHPAAQAAARAIAQAVSICHTPTHTLGATLYGTTAMVYDRVGYQESTERYDALAEEACGHMMAALQAMAVEREPSPARIDWHPMTAEGSLLRRCYLAGQRRSVH